MASWISLSLWDLKRESALGVFNSVSPAASVYTVFGAIRNPNHGVCFAISPLDFYRKVDGMNRAALTMKNCRFCCGLQKSRLI